MEGDKGGHSLSVDGQTVTARADEWCSLHLNVWLFSGDFDGYVVAYLVAFAVSLSWNPFWHGFNHSDGFFVENGMSGLHNFHIGDGTVFLNREIDHHTAFQVVFLGFFWVSDVVVDVFQQGCLSSREGGLGFWHLTKNDFFLERVGFGHQ